MKENQRVAVTKRMLKEGLLRLLAEKPLDKIHVNELCREAGINRTTFYRHYQMPQDVLTELEQELVGEILAGISSKRPDTVAEARKMLEVLCVRIYERAELFRVLFRYSGDEDMRRRLNDFYNQLWELHKTDPRMAEVDEDTAMLASAMLGGGCYYLLRCWILQQLPKTPQQIAAILSSLIRWPLQTDTAF